MFKRRETIIFSFLIVGIILFTLLQLNNTFFIYGISVWLLYFLLVCTLIFAIYRFIKDKRELPIFEKSKPLLFGIAAIAFAFFLSYLADTDGGKKRMITGGLDHDLHFLYFQLFRDKRFKLLNSGPFGGTIYRGTYTLTKDTLKIDNSDLKYLYPSLTLILKQDNQNRKYFDPADTSKSMFKLYIYEDFRED